MNDQDRAPTVAEIVRKMSLAERLLYAQHLVTSSLLADMIADRLLRMPPEAAEAYKQSRRTSKLRLAQGFGPIDQAELEAIESLASDQMSRLLDTISEREAGLRGQRGISG